MKEILKLIINIQKGSSDTYFSKYLDKQNKKVHSLVYVLINNRILLEGAKLNDIDIKEHKFIKFYLDNKENIFKTQPTLSQQYKDLSKNKDEIIEYVDLFT